MFTIRRVVFFIGIVFIFLIITGCKGNAPANISQTQEVTAQINDKIVFQDPTVEAYTRSLLNIPKGDITDPDVEKITVFGDSKNGSGSFGDISSPIKTLHDFQHFKNLKKLVLSGCNISNPEGLENLDHLEELHLRRNNISDLTPLANLVNLRVLDLAENRDIKDLSPLSSLVNLEKLLVEGTNLSLEPLKNLSSLKELYVPFSGVSDINSLTNLTNLTYLQLFHNNISDISPLKNMKQLNYLEISLNPIKDITVFDDLHELTYISVDTEKLSVEQIRDHLYSRHWKYTSTGQPLIYVDVTTDRVSTNGRTYKILLSYSKDMSQAFETISFDSNCDIEKWSEYFICFSDENNDGFLDLLISSGNSTKGMNYITYIYNKDTKMFVKN